MMVDKGEIKQQLEGREPWLAKETTDDPREFIERFLASEVFLKGRKDDRLGRPKLRGFEEYKADLEIKGIEEPEREVLKVFLESDDAKLLLLRFAKYNLMLEYNPSKFDRRINGVFELYSAAVERISHPRTELKIASLPTTEWRQEEMGKLDTARQFRHNQLMKALVEEGYCPTERLARSMARIMLISVGKDTFEIAQQDEMLRFRRLMEAAGG